MSKLKVKDIIYIATTALLVGGLVTTSILLINKKQKEETEEQISYMQAYYNNKVFAFQVENANYSKGQIVFIGDSITDLYHLDDHYADLDKVTYNRGIGGDTTSGVLKRLYDSLYAIEPSKIVLMIGINDINSGVEKQTTIDNYQQILNGIKTNLPEAKLYAMSILPMHDAMPDYVDLNKATETIKSINTQIKSMSENLNYQYFDLFSLVKDDNERLRKEYSEDGIHLNEAGFTIWTNLVKPSLM